MATERRASLRATDVWKRLCGWYGARMAEQYGLRPPPDWCQTIDDASREAIDRALAEIKVEHTIHPPTYPEFDAIVSKHSRAQLAGPSTQERLRTFVLKNRALTRGQLWQPWTFGFVGGQCAFVDIPADEESNTPGFRVRVADMPVGFDA